jgi:hypothetical protein
MTVTEIQALVAIIGGVVAAGGVLVATFKVLVEWRRATEQRQEELKLRQREFRQKQATFARELTREVFSDPKARAALKLLDSLSFQYVDDDGTKHRIRREELQPALRTSDLTFTDVQKFVRASFEALYDYLEQIEQLIRLDVINFEDIETVFRYYMVQALQPDVRHFQFLDHYDYPRAKQFIQRFEGKAKKQEGSLGAAPGRPGSGG